MLFDIRTEENRKRKRFRADQRARIILPDLTSHDCTIKDISFEGARILLPPGARLSETFDLVMLVNGHRVYPAELRWREGDMIGVSYGREKEPSEMLGSNVPLPARRPRQAAGQDGLRARTPQARPAASAAGKTSGPWSSAERRPPPAGPGILRRAMTSVSRALSRAFEE